MIIYVLIYFICLYHVWRGCAFVNRADGTGGCLSRTSSNFPCLCQEVGAAKSSNGGSWGEVVIRQFYQNNTGDRRWREWSLKNNDEIFGTGNANHVLQQSLTSFPFHYSCCHFIWHHFYLTYMHYNLLLVHPQFYKRYTEQSWTMKRFPAILGCAHVAGFQSGRGITGQRRRGTVATWSTGNWSAAAFAALSSNKADAWQLAMSLRFGIIWVQDSKTQQLNFKRVYNRKIREDPRLPKCLARWCCTPSVSISFLKFLSSNSYHVAID